MTERKDISLAAHVGSSERTHDNGVGLEKRTHEGYQLDLGFTQRISSLKIAFLLSEEHRYYYDDNNHKVGSFFADSASAEKVQRIGLELSYLVQDNTPRR